MSDCFVFRFYEPGDDKRKSVVIFYAAKVTLDVVAKSIKQDVADHLVPKNIYLMSLEQSFIKQEECKSDLSFVSEFESYVGIIDEHLRCMYSNSTGRLFLSDGTMLEENLGKAILHCGMIALFQKHGGLISSSPSYHFTKPSGDHSDKFIRASNLLVSSIEVSFLALSVLPLLHRDLRRIYVDTSSIAYLMSMAVQLYGNFDSGSPSIESFESYTVLNQPYDFVEDKSSLLLISATTSGSLARSLLSDTNFSNDQVVTLFHINLPEGQIGIFNVDEAIPQGIVSRKANKCPFCKQGAKLIRIAGDQFLPENPKHDLLVIKKDHFDKPRQSFFSQFAATGVLAWNTAVNTNEESREHFYIDVAKAVAYPSKEFSEALEKKIKRYVSRDLSVIVAFEDEGSEALVSKVREYLGENEKKVTWQTPLNLDTDKLHDESSVMVIAGAITSGRSLLAISRKLRCIDKSSTITYLVGFSKLPTEEAYEQLKNDLRQGGHAFVLFYYCGVPRIKEHTKTAWHWEKEALQQFSDKDPLADSNTQLPDSLALRYGMLETDTNDSNQLFLPNPQGQPLKLRRTFAFWSDLNIPDERTKNATQADVYWTIQCVLHDLRLSSDDKGLATTYHTTLISPANFDRYNDGIIQASLLRSAHPVELDYRVDNQFSRQMTDVILSVVENWEDSQGEASLEFLLALWTRRLQLNSDHLSEILKHTSNQMPESMRFLMDRLSDFHGELND